MRKIRVGLLIDELDIPFWEYRMIESINAGNYAEIVLVVRKKRTDIPERSFLARLKNSFTAPLFKLYTRVENKLSKPIPDAFTKKNIENIIKTSGFIEVDCIEKKFSDYVAEKDIAVIKEYKVDVFLRMGFRILRGEILKTAKMGIWSYHHGDNLKYRGGPAGHWEVLKRERVVGSVLQILTEDLDGGEVLYRSWSSVEPSVNKTLNGLFWKTSAFVPRKLKELYEKGEEVFFAKVKAENSQLYFYSGRNYTLPGNFNFLKYFIPHFFNRVRNKLWKLFNFEQWILLYSFSSSNSPATSIYRYKKLIPPKDRYWADPCVIYNDEKHYIFFEEVLYQREEEQGYICVVEIDKSGIKSDPVVILEKPYHLSYPFVFYHNGDYFLIPESEANSTIQLYQAVNFPYQWEFKMNLMENIKAVDATIFYNDNRFWLFTNVREMEGASFSEELFLFSSDKLLTNEWKQHPSSPIVSDVKSSRPAGRIFSHNGKFFRPSQNCSGKYGYSTVINEITELNENTYKEHIVSHILPDWDDKVVATHTLSFEQGLSVIDAQVKRRKRWFFF